MERICAAAHIRSYALFRNMWSMLPLDGSMSCQISRSRRSIGLIYSAYYCRPCESYIEGGQYAHCHLTHKSATWAEICVTRAKLAKICVKFPLVHCHDKIFC